MPVLSLKRGRMHGRFGVFSTDRRRVTWKQGRRALGGFLTPHNRSSSRSAACATRHRPVDVVTENRRPGTHSCGPSFRHSFANHPPDLLFDVLTPLGFRVRVTRERWELITTVKHPVVASREDMVRATLESPEQVRQSRSDAQVLLFYHAEGASRWVRAVARRVEDQGFQITACPTDPIKEGTQIWPK